MQADGLEESILCELADAPEAGLRSEKYYPNYACPEDGNIMGGRELTGSLARLGIRPDSHVVIYGTEPDGTLAAARFSRI